jgi:hypothetical protein
LSPIPLSRKLSEVPTLLHSSCGSKDLIDGDFPPPISPPSVNGKLQVCILFCCFLVLFILYCKMTFVSLCRLLLLNLMFVTLKMEVLKQKLGASGVVQKHLRVLYPLRSRQLFIPRGSVPSRGSLSLMIPLIMVNVTRKLLKPLLPKDLAGSMFWKQYSFFWVVYCDFKNHLLCICLVSNLS